MTSPLSGAGAGDKGYHKCRGLGVGVQAASRACGHRAVERGQQANRYSCGDWNGEAGLRGLVLSSEEECLVILEFSSCPEWQVGAGLLSPRSYP